MLRGTWTTVLRAVRKPTFDEFGCRLTCQQHHCQIQVEGVKWLHSYVVADRTYCIYEAPSVVWLCFHATCQCSAEQHRDTSGEHSIKSKACMPVHRTRSRSMQRYPASLQMWWKKSRL